MAYLVNLTARAERDLILLYEHIRAVESPPALRWYQGLEQAILSLEHHPSRCPATPENKRLRHLLYGNKPNVYRVIYRVRERAKRVDVLHVRHGAQRRFTIQDAS